MTQVGEGQEAGETAPPVMTFGAPTVGELLAERYELTEHVNDDSAGRMVWRGVDVVLRRPVAVVLRYPGGDSAVAMLQSAVAASRVVHPNLIGVYDAIDEEDRAYVVREWVDGTSLRELVTSGGPFDAARATTVAHAVAGALSAVHATGMVHGNVHPGTVLVADDGRVVLADARSDDSDNPEKDVRAVGGLLYFALTGHWPKAKAAGAEPTNRSSLPGAVRDGGRGVPAPRQIRAGVPTYLDDLTMDLLDTKIAAPACDVLAAELGRLDAHADEHYFDHPGPLRFASAEDDHGDVAPVGRRKVAVGVAGLVAIGLASLLVGLSAFASSNDVGDDVQAGPTVQPSVTASGAAGSPDGGQPQKLSLTADQVRVIDPDSAKRDELNGVEAVVDGDPNEGWETDSYERNPKFGGLKRGMGILVDLKEPRQVKSLQVVLSDAGASAELRVGTSDAPATSAGDKQILAGYTTRIGEPYERYDGSTLSFSAFRPDQKYQYLLLWITELPKQDTGKFKVGVQEIVVEVP